LRSGWGTNHAGEARERHLAYGGTSCPSCPPKLVEEVFAEVRGQPQATVVGLSPPY
jgi:hypothetical protein